MQKPAPRFGAYRRESPSFGQLVVVGQTFGVTARSRLPSKVRDAPRSPDASSSIQAELPVVTAIHLRVPLRRDQPQASKSSVDLLWREILMMFHPIIRSQPTKVTFLAPLYPPAMPVTMTKLSSPVEYLT